MAEARILLPTLIIAGAILSVALITYGRAKGAPGAGETWSSSVLGGATLIALALGFLVPALVSDEPLQTILEWTLLIVAFCFLAADVSMNGKKWWRSIVNGARMSE